MTPKGLILLFGTALLVMPEAGWCQTPPVWPVNSRVLRTAEGLPEPACISVSLAPQGRIYARHLKSATISRLDGYTVSQLPGPETGKGRIYESPGGQLWTAVAEGLLEFRNGQWVSHPVPEIAAEFQNRLPRLIDPVPLCPVRQDVVLFLLPDRLLQFSGEDQEHPRTDVILTAAQTMLGKFSCMIPARDGGLWIAGTHGLAKVAGPLRKLKPDWIRQRINRRCWCSSMESIGQPSWSPTKRHVLPGADRITLIGRPPLTRYSSGNRTDGTWSKARKALGANSTIWQLNLAVPFGWELPMALCAMPH
jgi:hypothetical protein